MAIFALVGSAQRPSGDAPSSKIADAGVPANASLTLSQILQAGNPPSGLSHRALFVAPLHELSNGARYQLPNNKISSQLLESDRHPSSFSLQSISNYHLFLQSAENETKIN